MIQIDMSGKSVLITGGTKGIGLASALKFAEAGARTYLTYKWGSANTEELFRKANAHNRKAGSERRDYFARFLPSGLPWPHLSRTICCNRRLQRQARLAIALVGYPFL